MADRLSYNQILENKKFIDNLLNDKELNTVNKEELSMFGSLWFLVKNLNLMQ